MTILHISLTEQGNDYASLRYFRDNPNNYTEHRLPLSEIQESIDRADTDYYTSLPVDYAQTGQALYNWLDTKDRLLANVLQESSPEGLIIAIATYKGLAHLPWELLHDGESFLVEKRPPIIPIRWVSNSEHSSPIEITNSPKNRPLNLLFMASSPLGGELVLDYEAEEGKILEATKRTPLNLRVEESGSLEELGEVVGEYETDTFDVFHLTGHATTERDNTPYFLTEDEYGACVYSDAGDIVDTLYFPLPSLIFLSGCRTGYSSDSVVPSMAEELLTQGAITIIGWGERVRDTDATTAASQFYRELSRGRTIIQALSSSYQALIEQQARDWHKLRFYVKDTLPQQLVTPLRTRGRENLPQRTANQEFRDDENRLRVVSREEFVGRRRQLQNCLRTLKTDNDKVGVLLHGMGGWGKSSIASRLWERLPEHEKVLWWRQIDESYLIKKLKDKLIKPKQQQLVSYLENSQIPLKTRFSYLFNELSVQGEKPFLFILDDFEFNLEPHEGQYILKPEVARILEALVEAIQETGTNNKIIITCRYKFDSELLEFFFSQGLEPFRKSELTKKLIRLEHFNSDNLSEEIRNRALNLADGNPRLLEYFNNEILDKEDIEAKLLELEQSPELWQDKIIHEELYQLINEPLQQVMSHCLVYEIPVPMAAMIAVCDSLNNYREQIQKGLELGLISISPEPEEQARVYHVSRILPHIIPTIRLPEAPEVYSLYHTANERLYEIWGNRNNETNERLPEIFNPFKINEKWPEIFRLLFAVEDYPERFRQGFSQMLSVQYNSSADKAFEFKLRQLINELPEENLCTQLEDYLRQGDWRKADEETAWLFYLVMVQQGYKNWYQLCQNFPNQILNEIDQLWVNYSQGHFGFSIQEGIWSSMRENSNADFETWINFCHQLEWAEENYSKEYESLPFSLESADGNLPARWITRAVIECGWANVILYQSTGFTQEIPFNASNPVQKRVFSSLASRLNL